MKTFKEHIKEEAPVNAVAHGGVDLNPTGKKKLKKNIFKRATVLDNKK